MSENDATNPGAGDELLPNDGVAGQDGQDQNDGAGALELELDENGDPIVAEPVEEVEEVEHEGKKYAIPKALKPQLMLQADYTRKTQELADQRRAVEAQAAATKADVEAREAFIKENAELIAYDDRLTLLDKEIAAFANVDWQAAVAHDAANGTNTVQLAQIELQRLKDQRDGFRDGRTKLQTKIESQVTERNLTTQRATAKQREECEAVLAREIPGWSEKRPKVEAFAEKALGIPLVALQATTDPRIFKGLELAMEGYEARQAKTTRKQAEAVQAVRPAAQVRGAAPATAKDPSRMSADEWQKWRNSQLKTKRGR
jgi:hypothetical protein